MNIKKTSAELEYEEFLDSWEPTDLLEHVTRDSNLFDPVALANLLADIEGTGTIPRKIKSSGYNGMCEGEAILRKLKFFEESQNHWSADFRERLLDEGVREDRVEAFITAMATIWTDGGRRQTDIVMQRLKAGVYLHDLNFHAQYAGKYVINKPDDSLDPLFNPLEVQTLFEINERMLELHLAEYIEKVNGDREGSINQLYVRRGVCMPHAPKAHLEEAHYLSSYSLASGPVELFAQTQGKAPCNGMPCIFAGPVPAIQSRVVAFAPFIAGMNLDQMEFVVAPPVRSIALKSHQLLPNATVAIHDYEFM